jgi:putative ABC transport system ATP-binding protein
MDTIISAVNIKKSYEKTEILHGVSLDVRRGEVLAIMGPSGSGKSTLLHSLASIINIDSGQVVFNGHRIDNLDDNKKTILRRTVFGFVFQFGQLVPELSAEDNVALPLLLNGVKRDEAYKQAQEYLSLVDLSHYYHSLPGKLSGGQMQRVAIARAMVIKPDIIFADEPTGSLDSLNSEKVMELFVGLAKKNNVTIIMVTHEPNIAAYADREVFVHDGKINISRK